MNGYNEEKLRQIEWFLEKSVQEPGTRETSYAPPYGDITELNTNRLIIDSVGKEMLQEIAENAIDLLDTSVAVYEANGDYAFGMFSSGWCRFMDAASRSLCNTDDNQEALNCGKWLCHENCWNNSAKPAIKSGHSTDIECVGGIHLYAEPIYAGDQVIGVINIGYGDPPTHREQLKMLAERFDVDPVKLREIAQSYRPRAKVIVDLAKKQLRSWAKLIGNTVERIQAQKARSESEALLSRTQQLAHVGSWELDVPENRLTWSDETYHIFGLNPQEFDATYEAFLDVVHPDDRAAVDKAYSDSLRKGKDTYEIEHRIVRRHSGEIRHVCEKCVHERDTAGMIIRSIGMVQDITEPKEAEAALRESEERYRAIYDQSPIGIELYDQAGMLLDVNNTCLDMFGVQNVQDLRGFGLFSDPNLEEEHKERLRSGKYVRYEVIFDFEKVKEAGLYDTSRSGSIWLDVLITPIFWDSLRGYLVQVQDISHRKHAEEALLKSEERYRGLFAAIPDGALVHDAEGVILDANEALARRLEVPREALTGRNIAEFVVPENAVHITANAEKALMGKTLVFDTTYISASGRTTPAEVHERSLPWWADDSVLLSISRDITERRQAEEALRKSEERFRDLYDDAPVGYFEYDLRGNITQVNRTELQMLGYSVKEMIGQPCWKFIVDETAREQILAKLAGTRPPAVGLERTYRRKDGTTFPVLFQDRLLTDEAGHITGIRTSIQDITDHKRAEEALRESEEKYRGLVEGLNDAVYRMALPEGRYEYFSSSTEDVFGYTSEEFINNPLFIQSIIHPDSAGYFKEKWKELLKGNVSERYEYKIIDSEGNERWIVQSNKAIFDDSGKIKAIEGLCRNVTERKRAEDALHESEERFRTLIESMAEGIVLKDASDRYVHWNLKASEVFGIGIDDLEGQTTDNFYRQIIHEDGSEFHKDDLPSLHTLRTGKPCQNVVMGITRGPEDTVWIKANTTPYFEAKDDRLSGVIISFSDITELRRAEEATRKSEQEKSLILDNASEIIAFHNKDRRFIWANRAYLDRVTSIKGLPMTIDDLKGKKCYEAWGLTGDCTNCPVSLAIESGKPQEGELTPENQEHWPATQGSWMVRATPVRDSSGALVGVIEISNDITERKRAEAEKEKLQAQLTEAQRMEAIGTLAGGIAHDFNNILSPLMIHAEMVLMDLPSDSPLKTHVKQIYQASERARDLVKQILTFARKQEASRAPIKMSLMVKEVVEFLRPTIPTTIDIQYDLRTDQDMVLGDPTELNQLFLNLSTNAAHAMEEGGGSLMIRVDDETLDFQALEKFPDLEPGPYVVVRVEDTGQGIDPQLLDKIFEPYFTTKETGKGTGIGLAVVHGIVKSYGGDITVDSELGRGTCFNIYLPQVQENGHKIESNKGPLQLPKGHERILFLDDEEAVEGAVRPMLEVLGYSVTAKRSSVKALAAFTEDPDAFDLIITDQTMPEMTGKELARKVLAIRPDFPIILCTGYSPEIDEKRAKAMGIRGFVMKPIVMKEMAHTIREVLDSV